MRTASLYGLENDPDGNPKYGELGALIEQYGKLAQECANGYQVDQQAGDAHISGVFCHAIDYPFTLNWSMPGVTDGLIRFLPSSDQAGGWSLTGSYQAVVFFDSTGDYTVQLSDQKQPLTLSMTGSDTTHVPKAGVSVPAPFDNSVLNLEALNGTCSESK